MRYQFQFRPYRLPFRAPIRTAHGWWKEREGLILKLSDAEGISGFGEVAPIPWFGTETVEQAEKACRSLGEFLTEEEFEMLPTELACVRGGCRNALESLKSKQHSVLSGGVPAELSNAYLPVAGLLPAGKDALGKLPILCEAGFRFFKWKVGVGDLADEMGILDDLISSLPSKGTLRLDANGAWTLRQAQRWMERLAERPIEFVEQPISHMERNAEDILSGLANEYPTPIALDESVATDAQVSRWLELEWPGIFVLKPALMEEPLRIIERLNARKAEFVFSSALETAVGARAGLTLALHHGKEGRAVGFGVWPLFADDRFDGPHLAPFIRRQDVDTLDSQFIWSALN